MEYKVHPLAHARDVAVEAALSAARLIREKAGRLDAGAIRSKGTHDLVTDIDEAAQKEIVRILRNSYPEYGILAEEEMDQHIPEEGFDGYRWIIDPIDGTTNFTHGLPPYAVSIGLQREDRIVAAVVLDVSRTELFTAVAGGGLYVNGIRMGVSRTETLDDSLLTTGFPYREVGYIEEYLKVLEAFMRRTRGVRRPGSASIDLAYVACGRFDGFFETGLKAWDVAAGALLVTEGGGRIADFAGGPDVLFGGQVLASNGLIHAEMQEVLAPLRDVRR